MKNTVIIAIFVFSFAILTAIGFAQSPQDEITRMVSQLQKAPTDSALREKIIRLAATTKPEPVVPDEAIRFEGRAQFAFKDAKSVDEYLGAAKEYEKAVAAAPWVLGYYSDLCTIYEKAAKFEDAKRNCGFYLIGLSDPTQITEAKRRIAGLEFGIEKANSPEARAAKQKSKEEEMLKGLEGAVFILLTESARIEQQYRVSNGRIVYWTRRLAVGGCMCASGAQCDGSVGEEGSCPYYPVVRLDGRRGERATYGIKGAGTIEIAEDGQSLVEKYYFNGDLITHVYRRR